jgi:hypothetical protein
MLIQSAESSSYCFARRELRQEICGKLSIQQAMNEHCIPRLAEKPE